MHPADFVELLVICQDDYLCGLLNLMFAFIADCLFDSCFTVVEKLQKVLRERGNADAPPLVYSASIINFLYS